MNQAKEQNIASITLHNLRVIEYNALIIAGSEENNERGYRYKTRRQPARPVTARMPCKIESTDGEANTLPAIAPVSKPGPTRPP